MSLNDRMEMDHVVQVLEDGSVIDRNDLYGPEVYDDTVEEPWTLLTGFTGQYGYNGPAMHSSEYVGGGLERHILENPGYYVTLMDYSEENPTEWYIAYKA